MQLLQRHCYCAKCSAPHVVVHAHGRFVTRANVIKGINMQVYIMSAMLYKRHTEQGPGTYAVIYLSSHVNSCHMYNVNTHSYSMHFPFGLHHAGLGGLPWRTEALEEALLHLDSWSGWFHRSNGREVVRTLIAEASPTELNHMVSFELHAHWPPSAPQALYQSSDSCSLTH